MTEARKLVICVIIILVALAGVGTWLTLGWRQAGRLQISIDQKRKELTTLQEKVAAVPELRQERHKLTSQLDEYETILPNDRELNKIYDTLSEYQKKSGIEIRTFTPIREKEDRKSVATYKRVSYDLDLNGDYFSLIRFLNLLENHNRFMQVDSFTVKQKDEDSLNNEISVRVSTFVYDPQSPKAAPVTKSKAGAAAAKKAAAATANKAPEVPFDLPKELSARFVYAGRTSMRDPFTNPLTRRVASVRPDTPRAVVQRNMSPEEEREAADEVEKKLAAAEPLIAQDKLDEAAKLLDETAFIRGTFRDETLAERVAGLSREWQRLDTVLRTAQGEKLYRTVEETYEKMVQAFDSEDYDEVFKLRKSLDVVLGRESAFRTVKKDARGKTTEKPALPAEAPKDVKDAKDAPAPAPAAPAEARDPIHERLEQVVKACDTLVTRAQVRKEFSAVAIRIQGTFWSGRGDNRRAAAIINGKMLGEGDVLKSNVKAAKSLSTKAGAPPKPESEIVIKKIDRDKVVFAYRDELIERSQYKLE